MKVILTMDVEDLGGRGDQVDVAAGYARNFLIPRRMAVPHTSGNERIMAEESRLSGVREGKAKGEAERVGQWLAEHEIIASLKIGREGKAFGAVTSKDLAVLLRKEGLEVDRRRIRLDAPLKRLGIFEVPIAIHADVETKVRVFVDREGGSKDGARSAEAVWEAERKAAEDAARAEAEARAEREREAEEAARIAIEKSAARKAREEELAAAREEARQRPSEDADGQQPEGQESKDASPAAAAEEAGESS